MKTITAGRITANIHTNGKDDYLVIVTRDGRCLPGIGAKHYKTMKAAEKGAASMMAKA